MSQPKKPASQKPKKGKQPLLDPATAKEKMRRADAKRFDETLERYKNHPLPVSINLKNDGSRKWTSSYQGDDQDQLVGHPPVRNNASPAASAPRIQRLCSLGCRSQCLLWVESCHCANGRNGWKADMTPGGRFLGLSAD
jgi:hypothetical protein